MPLEQIGRQTVTTAGTAVRLVDQEQPVVGRVDITALTTNTGNIYLGDRNVSGQSGYEAGFLLQVTDGKPDVLTLYNQQLYDIWLDSTVNGEGVFWASTAGAE